MRIEEEIRKFGKELGEMIVKGEGMIDNDYGEYLLRLVDENRDLEEIAGEILNLLDIIIKHEATEVLANKINYLLNILKYAKEYGDLREVVTFILGEISIDDYGVKEISGKIDILLSIVKDPDDDIEIRNGVVSILKYWMKKKSVRVVLTNRLNDLIEILMDEKEDYNLKCNIAEILYDLTENNFGRKALARQLKYFLNILNKQRGAERLKLRISEILIVLILGGYVEKKLLTKIVEKLFYFVEKIEDSDVRGSSAGIIFEIINEGFGREDWENRLINDSFKIMNDNHEDYWVRIEMMKILSRLMNIEVRDESLREKFINDIINLWEKYKDDKNYIVFRREITEILVELSEYKIFGNLLVSRIDTLLTILEDKKEDCWQRWKIAETLAKLVKTKVVNKQQMNIIVDRLINVLEDENEETWLREKISRILANLRISKYKK